MIHFFTGSVTAICLLGTILNVKKCIGCFYLWTIGNILWFIFDIYSKLYSRALLDFVQLCFAVWGIIEWSKPNKER